MKPKILALLCLTFLATLGRAQSVADRIIYLSTTGSDSNSGLSWSSAKLTLAGANSALTNGGSIMVGAGSYTVSANVNFSKSVAIFCVPHQTTFASTVTSGAAITFSYGNGSPDQDASGAGIYGCTLTGPGSTSTSSIGIQLGTGTGFPTGAYATTLENVTIGLNGVSTSGFGTGIQFDSSGTAFLVHMTNPQITECGIGIDMNGENNSIVGGSMSGNATGLKVDTGAEDFVVTGTSFDSNTAYGIDCEANGDGTLSGVHFENNGVSYTDFLLIANVCRISHQGGVFYDSRSSGTQSEFVKLTAFGTSYQAVGVNLYSAGITVTQAVNFAGLGSGGFLQLYNDNPTAIPIEFSNPYSGRVTNIPNRNDVTHATATFQSYNLVVDGTISVSGTKSFRIDHPLDPTNKYLYHSSVESPDMLNLYDGIVALDASGQATVTLPDYFQALNQDFRYQLTPVGSPAPGLYVAKKIEGNTFRIAGGLPHAEVSWQVTGIRHDAYANAHRMKVEETKPTTELGHYSHPELYTTPVSNDQH